MTGASKILTVSYGTFSCTLEGFDDPFNTMKAIAEYFRDLAAEDRYFGAEPPTPDAAMLHKIAEREIQRRVEAKVQENGVVLRASDGNAPAIAAAPAPVVDAAPVAPRLMEATAQTAETVAEKLSRLRAEVAAQSPAQSPTQSPAPAPAPAATALSLTVPSVTSYSVPEFVSPDFGEDDEYDLPAQVLAHVTETTAVQMATTGAEQGADAFVTPPEQAAPVDAIADVLPEERPDPAADLPEDQEAGTDSTMAEAADIDRPAHSDADMTEAAAADPVAADPFAQDDSEEFSDPAETASILADGVTTADIRPEDRTDALLSSLMADLADPRPADTLEAAPEATTEAWDHDDDLQETLNAIASETVDAPAPGAEAETRAESDVLAALDGMDDIGADRATAETAPSDVHPEEGDVAEIAPSEAPEPESIFTGAAPADETVDTTPEGDDFSLFAAEDTTEAGETEPFVDGTADTAAVADSDPQAEMPAADLRPEASEKLMRARARVIRIRRTEAASPVSGAEPAPAAEPPTAAATLSPEAEADLAAELAALSAATNGAVGEGSAPGDHGPATAVETNMAMDEPALSGSPSEAPRRAFDQAGADDTISRLMAQADEHLEGPENKRRLSAIAHLKAAVAATVAERRATSDKPKDAEPSQLSRYRDDLAKVVRSKVGGGSAATERLAPLVLVSEQRIDRPRPVAVPQPGPAATVQPAAQLVTPPAGPVMPRRIAGASSLAFAQDEEEMEALAEAVADSGDFSEFAERLGAKSLSELIEASAAYLACVERREHFTRPQLMGLVQAALPGGDIPREDGLRSFGTLLRTGRIEKVRRGQFALSDQSAYLAEGRRIAG